MPRRLQVFDGIPEDVAREIRLVILDVDGVQTDGGVYIGSTAAGEAVELKRFDITDGLGIKILMSAGIPVVLVSGRTSPGNRNRAVDLGIPWFEGPGGNKLAIVEGLLKEHDVEWSQVACVCDDLADLPILRRTGLPVAVANAVPEVKAVARYTTRARGGNGAVREFVEALLHARGEWSSRVDAYVDERGG
jgi:3-deoxy-D-manno-octulosonate 8-phosphate phosphatase (KDO 8-P phosphatase)